MDVTDQTNKYFDLQDPIFGSDMFYLILFEMEKLYRFFDTKYLIPHQTIGPFSPTKTKTRHCVNFRNKTVDTVMVN